MSNFDIDKLKSFSDVEILPVDCPEWADAGYGKIYVRTMSGKARDTYEMAVYNASQKGSAVQNMRAMLVVATACDEAGNLIFKQSDADWLGEKSAKVLERLFNKAQAVSGISDGDVEQMEKHFETSQN